jgi:hypothetical protein
MTGQMLRLEHMPDDNADLANVAVSFPTLPDAAAEPPVSTQEILDYLALEVPDGDRLRAKDLVFLRTAQVAEMQYWLWRFTEPGGGEAYATVSRSPDGTVCVGFEGNDYGLAPEQFMLSDYHNVF